MPTYFFRLSFGTGGAISESIFSSFKNSKLEATAVFIKTALSKNFWSVKSASFWSEVILNY